MQIQHDVVKQFEEGSSVRTHLKMVVASGLISRWAMMERQKMWLGLGLGLMPGRLGRRPMRLLQASGTSVVLVQTRAGTDSADAVGRAGRCSSDEDGGARSDPAGSGRDGSISGGFGVQAAGSGEIKGWWRHGPSGGPCSARKRERGERRSRGRRRGARRRSGRSSGGEARRRCGVAGEAACGGEGSSGRMEQREAERSGLGWVFRVIFVN